MTKTKATLTALLVSLLVACAGLQRRESQIPRARQVWSRVRVEAIAGQASVPGAPEQIAALDQALASGDRLAIRVVDYSVVHQAVAVGLADEVERKVLDREVAAFVLSRSEMLGQFLRVISEELPQ